MVGQMRIWGSSKVARTAEGRRLADRPQFQQRADTLSAGRCDQADTLFGISSRHCPPYRHPSSADRRRSNRDKSAKPPSQIDHLEQVGQVG